MTVRSRIIISVLIVIGMICIVMTIRKRKIDLRYALVWLLVCLGILVFTVFPKLLELLSDCLGIATPVNMLFFVGFCLSLIIIYTLSISTSRLSAKVKVLTQEMAILKHDMKNNEILCENKTAEPETPDNDSTENPA